MISPTKGARCVARKRVYSRALRRHVLRCRKFEGGRVGLHKKPRRKTNARCLRKKRVYSRALRKTVLRCAKYSKSLRTAHYRMPPMMVGYDALFPPAAPAWVMPVLPEKLLLLPPDAKSLKNRERVFRRLQSQMRKLKPSMQSQTTMSRWPANRPKVRS